MPESYQRPVDRPHILFCRVCDKQIPDVHFIGGKERPDKPLDITNSKCNECGITGSAVFRWEEPKEKRTLPHCGDPNCIGLCADPLCLPDERIPSRLAVKPKPRPSNLVGHILVSFFGGIAAGELARIFWKYFF